MVVRHEEVPYGSLLAPNPTDGFREPGQILPANPSIKDWLEPRFIVAVESIDPGGRSSPLVCLLEDRIE